MKIIVPYAIGGLSPETVLALGERLDIEFRDVSADITAYFDLLEQLWAAGEHFCVVEQDIVVRAGTLASFEACANPWCAAPYPYLGSGAYAGLGCARFRTSLMEKHPDLMDLVALHDYDGHSPKHWCTLDAAIQRELWKAGEHACTSHLPVGHLHDWPTHGCVA